MRKLFGLFLVLFLLMFSGCSLFAEKSIDVGLFVPLSGDLEKYGDMVLKVINLSVEEINLGGGINGYKINLIVYDDMCDRDMAKDGAEKFIAKDIKFIFGSFCSDSTLGIAEISEINDVILFSPGATSSELSNIGDYIFRTSQSNVYDAKEIANDLYAEGYKNPAVFYQLSEFTLSLKLAFVEEFKLLHGETSIISSFDPINIERNLNDFLDLVESNDVDSIYFISLEQDSYRRIIKILESRNITLPLYTNGRIMDIKSEKDLWGYLNGIKFAVSNIDKNSQKSKELIKILENNKLDLDLNEYLFMYITYSYDLPKVFAKATSMCDDVFDTVCVKNNLYGLEEYSGYSGKIFFDENGDPSYGSSIFEFRDGEAILIN